MMGLGCTAVRQAPGRSLARVILCAGRFTNLSYYPFSGDSPQVTVSFVGIGMRDNDSASKRC